MLLGSGLSEALVNLLQEESRLELESLKLQGYIRVQNVYALKKEH